MYNELKNKGTAALKKSMPVLVAGLLLVLFYWAFTFLVPNATAKFGSDLPPDKQLVSGLYYFAAINDGAYPKNLDIKSTLVEIDEIFKSKSTEDARFPIDDNKVSDLKFGIEFFNKQNGTAYYKGVRAGDADRVLAQWVEGDKTILLYGDLKKEIKRKKEEKSEETKGAALVTPPAWIEAIPELRDSPFYAQQSNQPRTRAEYLEQQRKKMEKLKRDREAAIERAKQGKRPSARPTKPAAQPKKQNKKVPEKTRPETIGGTANFQKKKNKVKDKDGRAGNVRPGLMFKFKIDLEWGIGWGNIDSKPSQIASVDQALFDKTNELYRNYLDMREKELEQRNNK